MAHPRRVAVGLAVLGVVFAGCADDGDGPTTTVTEADPDPTPGAATDDGTGDGGS